jgi:hypothetical protein
MSARFRGAAAIAALLVACGSLVGCGSQHAGHVSGKVTFKGQPVPAGKVYITPDGSKGNTGPTGFATITNGTYDTAAAGGQAAASGAVIIAVEGIDPKPPPGAGPDVTTTVLFARYEKQVELTDSNGTHDIDVPAEAANGPPQPAASRIVVP